MFLNYDIFLYISYCSFSVFSVSPVRTMPLSHHSCFAIFALRIDTTITEVNKPPPHTTLHPLYPRTTVNETPPNAKVPESRPRKNTSSQSRRPFTTRARVGLGPRVRTSWVPAVDHDPLAFRKLVLHPGRVACRGVGSSPPRSSWVWGNSYALTWVGRGVPKVEGWRGEEGEALGNRRGGGDVGGITQKWGGSG